jgi:peptidylprolyl isomerase
MALIVHSPHDGQAVKVRDQDLQRAIRDGEGRIFYAVKCSDGEGYYGSFTRKGSDKDEQRCLDMLKKTQRAREVGAERSAQQIHDATGRSSGSGVMRWLVLSVVAAIIAAVTWYYVRPDNVGGGAGGRPAQQHESDSSSLGEGSEVVVSPSLHTSLGVDGVGVRGGGGVDAAVGSSGTYYVGTTSGLRYIILQAGTGEAAVAGRYVQIHFVASTLSGQEIDRSDPEQPVGYVLWSGRVLRGWDEGVAGMRVGEKRRMILPPELLVGRYPGSVVLPQAPIQFDIELVGVLPGIRSTTDKPGHGSIARPGDMVRVHYRAFIGRAATAYDNSYDRGEPIEFRIGAGEVIQGWELGVIGMSEGETRTIEIPSYLGYGGRGAAGVIPPGSSLRYTIELLKVTGPASRYADIGFDRGS